MPRILPILRKSIVSTFVISLLISMPAAVTFADTSPEPCVAPTSTQPGVHQPTGADAVLFTYQCDGAYAGTWTSAHYMYDPATGARTALDSPVYTYNSTTGLWDSSVWDFSAAKGGYQLVTVSVTTPPAGAQTVGGPVAKTLDPADSTSNATTPSSDSPTAGSDPNNPTGTGVTLNGTATTNVNNSANATMNNGVLSVAGSGNAAVAGNTSAGNAATGSANSVANIINLLQSSSNVLGSPNMVSFTANINGDVNGDLLLNPAMLGAMQPANVSTTLDNNVTVNNSTNSALNNDINLAATSGNAAVSGNTQAGDASTGNATAVANIVNTLNSYVTAGKSFIGVININGNLNGDILLPPDFVDTLLASNVPHYNVTTAITSNATVANVNNASIANNVTAAAASGQATVSDNTGAGNATSGSAKTNLTVFNLTGSQVVASNDLLVFVNVLGTWYGMILNAPAGTTAASLGGGVTTNASIDNNATLTNTNNQAITNNVNVKAATGDATVSHNTSAANAKTGDATASVNIANMINDRLTLDGWFGLLFINVFGSWNGSFGFNTSAGDPLPAPQSSGAGTNSPTFQFAPSTATTTAHAASSQAGSNSGSAGGTSGDVNSDVSHGTVLAAHASKAAGTTPNFTQDGSADYLLPLLGGGLALALLLAGERNRFFRNRS